jgi:SpoVK/Ycf46/Vps4 family AAA+-type ATPase
MSDETLQELLREEKWLEAIPHLVDDLNHGTDKATSSYNLVVCYIKIKQYRRALRILKSYGRMMPQNDRLVLEEELKSTEAQEALGRKKEVHKKDDAKTEIADGQVQKFGWFKSTTKFDEVIGLKKVKKDLLRKVIGPMTKPDIYKRVGAVTSGGIILYGPPGTGKTLLARACAGEAGGKMLNAKISEVVSKFQGESSKNIATLFAQARDQGPALIFIDELDSVAQKRENTAEATTGPEERRIIDTFLTEIDGVGKDNKGVFALGASNMPWAMDEAFVRAGRFGKSIYVGPPNRKDRSDLFKFYLKGKMSRNINYLKLSLATFGFTPADIMNICDEAASKKAAGIAFDNKKETPITTSDLMKEVNLVKTPMLFSWYSNTLEELRKLSPEKIAQYPELKADIKRYYAQGKSTSKLLKLIVRLIPN